MNLLINLLAEQTNSSTTSSAPSNPLTNALIWIIPIALIILFMFINSRQRKKQQQEVDKKMNSLKVGDVVKTIGLIYGEIVEIDREMETFVLKTGSEENCSYIKVDKMAIYQVIPPIESVDNGAVEVEENEEVAEETTAQSTETTEE